MNILFSYLIVLLFAFPIDWLVFGRMTAFYFQKDGKFFLSFARVIAILFVSGSVAYIIITNDPPHYDVMKIVYLFVALVVYGIFVVRDVRKSVHSVK